MELQICIAGDKRHTAYNVRSALHKLTTISARQSTKHAKPNNEINKTNPITAVDRMGRYICLTSVENRTCTVSSGLMTLHKRKLLPY
jgi:hypothetical protein